MTNTHSLSYIDPTQEAGRAFFGKAHSGPIVMLNLLRFRRVADYAGDPELAPATPISGAEAYRRYVEHTLPFLRASGGEIMFLGKAGNFLIGPSEERWDAVMLIKQSSVASFVAFASNAEYMKGIGHRTAALEDSRLLPISEGDPGQVFTSHP